MDSVIIKTTLTEVSSKKKGIGLKTAGMKLVYGTVPDLMQLIADEDEVLLTVRKASPDLFETPPSAMAAPDMVYGKHSDEAADADA